MVTQEEKLEATAHLRGTSWSINRLIIGCIRIR